MLTVKGSGVPVRVTVEFKCVLCGKIAIGERRIIYGEQEYIFPPAVAGWRMLGPAAVCCPQHPGVELRLVKDGQEFIPGKDYWWEDKDALTANVKPVEP